MRIILNIWFVFLSFSAITLTIYTFAQTTTSSKTNKTHYVFDMGEELTYIVKYAFLNLGEVKFLIKNSSEINGKEIVKAASYMDSYEGLPFLELHQKYYSFIDPCLFPVKFLGVLFEEDTNFVKYVFNRDSSIYITRGNYNTGKVNFDSTVYVNTTCQDGLSILFYTRKYIGTDSTHIIPCFVNEKKETTKINFYSDSESVEIDNVDYEIDCLKIDGETDFVSVYGLTGEFEGWFSNDVQAVPIKAKMNVIIGSVTIELLKWKKENWNPPKYNN
jgi:hypothetical protein